MSGNTSATGGPLSPSGSVQDDQALDDFFQAWVVGLTGYPGQMVRPDWQPESTNISTATQDWVAFRISVSGADTNAVNLHRPDGDGYNQLRRHQVLTIRFSFYGPNASSFADLLRDGAAIPQNCEPLQLNNMGIIGFGDQVPAPELVKGLWYRRVDMELQVKRQIVRTYQVQNLDAADISLDNERYVTLITVKQP